MSTTQATLINTDPGFRPHIEGTRITIQQVAERHTYFDWSAERIAQAFRLTMEQVYAALAYYHGHKAEIDRAIIEDMNADSDLPNLDAVLDGTLQLVMTPKEIAEEYPISEHAVYQAIRRERLRARQSGKTWLVLRRDAEKLWGHKK